MDGGDFLNRLEHFLSTANITSEDVKHAVKMIKERRYRCGGHRVEGPCLRCGEKCLYLPHTVHIQCGDRWLDKLLKEWKEPPTVGSNRRRFGGDLTLNSYSPLTVYRYMCPKCKEETELEIKHLKESEYKQQRLNYGIQQKSNKRRNVSIVRGETKATISKRFQAMLSIITQKKCEQLAKLPYVEFLETTYWDIVRRYKLKQDGFRCSLCEEKGTLHVHHKSYEHHGWEHCYLKDLITLCHKCHGTHHNKLAL